MQHELISFTRRGVNLWLLSSKFDDEAKQSYARITIHL